MQMRQVVLTLAAGFALLAGPAAFAAGPALTGQVSSAEEGAMEGVVVSAHKAGSTITVSVDTNAQGRYRFPANRLDPGRYTLTIRAVGYDLDGKPSAKVAAGKTATANIKLRKTGDLSRQLTNAEWMISV